MKNTRNTKDNTTVDNKKDKMYSDISRLVQVLERIAKRVERDMKNNNYGK